MKVFKLFVIPFLSAMAGGLIVFAAMSYFPQQTKSVEENSSGPDLMSEEEAFDDIGDNQKEIQEKLNRLFDEGFIGQDDPFEAMRKMRQRMRKHFEDKQGDWLSDPFDSWFGHRFGGGTIDDIQMREDDSFVYYDVKVKDLKTTSISTKIENGYITISGKIDQKDSASISSFGKQSIFSSSFERSFPLPSNVDETKMEMIPQRGKIIIKFPKLNV